MFSLTKAAADQILASAQQSGMERMSLRVAASKKADGSFEYGMGFDEASDDDLILRCQGLEVIMSPQYEPLLQDTTVDYVTLDDGNPGFVFINPQDSNYNPTPSDDKQGGGCGCGSGGCN